MAKLALVTSVGGHLREMLALRHAYDGLETFWIINDVSPVLPRGERAYVVAHAERDLRVLWNLGEFAQILSREMPDAVLSTGAGPAIPAAIIARLLGIPFIYVETCAAVSRLTLTGRLIRPLASKFYVQWPQLQSVAPWATFVGGVL